MMVILKVKFNAEYRYFEGFFLIETVINLVEPIHFFEFFINE